VDSADWDKEVANLRKVPLEKSRGARQARLGVGGQTAANKSLSSQTAFGRLHPQARWKRGEKKPGFTAI